GRTDGETQNRDNKNSSHWTSGFKGSSARRDVIAVLMVTLTVSSRCGHHEESHEGLNVE
ncbi:hypothetical protein DPMN_019615, partial [Dreissena polymorpha]